MGYSLWILQPQYTLYIYYIFYKALCLTQCDAQTLASSLQYCETILIR